MRFIKTLRKADADKRNHTNDPATSTNTDEKRQVKANEPVGVLADKNILIGRPLNEVQMKDDVAVVEKVVPTVSQPHDSVVPGAFPVSSKGLTPVNHTIQPSMVNSHVVAITDPQSPYTEEFRVLRTQIIHSGQKEQVRSIVVSSIGPSEGKSVTALNMAWLMAQSEGRRALIIDADMRRPSISRYLSINPKVGLSHVLTGKAVFESSLINLEPAGLCFLPAGEVRDDISELLSGDNFLHLLEKAYEYFDIVIIDTPPISLFSDSALITNIADKALLVVRTNQVRYSDVGRILETFPKEKIFGSVLNDSEESLMHGGYYDYSSYYKRNGE